MSLAPVPMVSDGAVFDAVVIGGGFYGCAIAVYLVRQHGLRSVLLLEREPFLFSRASRNNQARVHNGYHYPRSFTTAYRSRVNLPQFVRDWPSAVSSDFTAVYAIARRNSKVNARQFRRFCSEIGASLLPADPLLCRLFEPRLIEEVFVAEEYVFDADALARRAQQELAACGVRVLLDTAAREVYRSGEESLRTVFASSSQAGAAVTSRFVFNCSYSGLNQLRGDFPGTVTRLKHEVTEMALVQMPPALKNLAVTVMDGPFFSLMPYPPRGLHTLSHVRYTPHFHWEDSLGTDPYERLAGYATPSRADRMLRDVSRYLPVIQDANHVDSLFEVKTVLARNEGDDGRPILFETNAQLPNYYSVLGGKVDNIYDVLEKLSGLPLGAAT